MIDELMVRRLHLAATVIIRTRFVSICYTKEAPNFRGLLKIDEFYLLSWLNRPCICRLCLICLWS